MSDQKINVDININADGLNQIPQYKAAFDSLNSLNYLSNIGAIWHQYYFSDIFIYLAGAVSKQ